MRTSLLLVCALVSAGLLSGPADARQRNDERQDRGEQRQERVQEQRQDRAQEQRQEQRRPEGGRDDRGDRGDRGDQSADAARLAQQRNGGGRVLAVEPEGRGYRVKVLKDGEVRTHHIDVDH